MINIVFWNKQIKYLQRDRLPSSADITQIISDSMGVLGIGAWFDLKNFKHSPLSREVSVRPRKWESGLLMSALNPWVECRVRSGALWVDQRSGLFTFQLRIFLSGWPNCSTFPGSSLTALKRSTSPLYVSFPSVLLPLSLSPSLPPSLQSQVKVQLQQRVGGEKNVFLILSIL